MSRNSVLDNYKKCRRIPYTDRKIPYSAGIEKTTIDALVQKEGSLKIIAIIIHAANNITFYKLVSNLTIMHCTMYNLHVL